MNSTLQSLFARRSVRRYEAREVDEAMVRDMLEAAMAAPSAVAKDPWHFIVVRGKDTLRRIADGLPNGKMLADAGVGIVVCGDMERVHDGQLSYLIQDCAAAIENVLLAASMLGLGGCWLGVHPREERVAHIRSLLEVPEHVVPISVMSIGWPAESPPARTRYRDDAVHHETW